MISIRHCKCLEFLCIFLFGRPCKAHQDLRLERVVKSSTFNRLNIQRTKYHTCCHKANLSKLQDWHNKEFQFEFWPFDLFHNWFWKHSSRPICTPHLIRRHWHFLGLDGESLSNAIYTIRWEFMPMPSRFIFMRILYCLFDDRLFSFVNPHSLHTP